MTEIAFPANSTATNVVGSDAIARTTRPALRPASSQHAALAALPLSEMALLLTDGVSVAEGDIIDEQTLVARPVSAISTTIAPAPKVAGRPPKFTPAPRPTSHPPQGGERAPELDLADLSLRLDNPLRASSLVPPARQRFGLVRVAIGAAVSAAICYLAALSFPSASSVPSAAPEAAAKGVTERSAHAVQRVAPSSGALMPASAVVSPVVSKIAAPTAERAALVPSPIPAPVASAPPSGQASNGRIASSVTTRLAASERAVGRKAAREARRRGERAKRTAGRRTTTVASVSASKESASVAPATVAQPIAPQGPAPSRQDIIAAFAAARGELTRCAAGAAGVAEIHATILNNGRVSQPHVAGAFEGSAASKCMERAVRNMTFAAFGEPRKMKIVFPVSL